MAARDKMELAAADNLLLKPTNAQQMSRLESVANVVALRGGAENALENKHVSWALPPGLRITTG